MTTKDEAEALRLALEALERFGSDSYALEQKAVIACREALEQPAGETLSGDQSALVDKLKALLSGPANLTTQEAGAVLDAIRALLSSDAQPSEWVGLSDEDLAVCDSDGVKLARYWERVLREKNAGKLFEDSLFFHKVKNSSNKLAPWLSAALEDPNSCSEFKAAIEWWFQSGITDIKHWSEAGKTVGINGLTHEEESATASVMGLVRKPAAEDKAGYDWSLLEATQESLREHMAIVKELQQRLAKYEAGGEPVKFLANGTRFKMSFFQNEDGQGNHTDGTHVTCFEAFEDELDGRWVALVPAEDSCHLKLTRPQPQEKK